MCPCVCTESVNVFAIFTNWYYCCLVQLTVNLEHLLSQLARYDTEWLPFFVRSLTVFAEQFYVIICNVGVSSASLFVLGSKIGGNHHLCAVHKPESN